METDVVPATVAEHESAVDARPRWRRLVAPLATIGGLGLATLFVALVDPNQPGHYPVCPTKLLTGIDCPGCGGLRATNALAHGDVVAAFDHNALFVLAVPVIVFFLVRNVITAWTGRPPRPVSAVTARRTMIAVMILVVVFTLVRNLPFAAYLGSS